MRAYIEIASEDPNEVVSLERDSIETVEDMLFFFHRVMEAAGFPYIDGVGAISKQQRFQPKEWWSTF